jgi:hypothetical protein
VPGLRTPALAPDPRLRRLDALGRLLDDSIRIPGTRRRIGVDAVIGLVPGLGDGAGAVLSTYIIVEAARFGVPRATLLRMAGNVAAEAILGVVPVMGDLFDAAWKANLRNLRLLHAHLEQPERARRATRRWAWGIVLGLVVLLAGTAAFAVWLGAAVLRMLFA